MNIKLNANFVKVVNILNDGEYHDGTSLGNRLHLTRSAVWKMIKKLENNKVKIDSIKGKGYALREPLQLLDLAKIKKQLLQKRIDLVIFESIGSTNEYLKAFKNSNNIKICLAEQQTQGKGRMGREWFSPFGKNIYMSCLYPFKKDVSELAGASLVVGLAVRNTLNCMGIEEGLFVKWPNDILYANKKISGCLIEIQAETHGSCQAMIGIGINVNMLHQKNVPISQSWTSMQTILNQYIDRNKLCANLVNVLLEYLSRFENQGLSPFMDEWKAADYLAAQKVSVKNVSHTITGKMLGINDQGHILLELNNGAVRAFAAGDTSVMKNT